MIVDIQVEKVLPWGHLYISSVYCIVFFAAVSSTIPEQMRKFYDHLSSILNKKKKREVIIIGGNFNAKAKTEHSVKDPMLNQITIGHNAKSKINENGKNLIEFCSPHIIHIANMFFKHKPIQ